MKKTKFSVITIVVALALCCAMLVGCGQNGPQLAATTSPNTTAATNEATTEDANATSSAPAGNTGETTAATAEDVDAVSSATVKDGNATSPEQAPGTSTDDIGAEEAKSIALKHAGVSASDVTFARTEKDYDNGRWVYEVEFYSQNKEYDYDVDASTGAIISYDYDAEYYNQPTVGADNSTSEIGVEKAKSIALKHAGLSESDVSFTKAKLEKDDGHKEYEVEFYHNGTEYDYTIDAYSGKIVEYDSERDD